MNKNFSKLNKRFFNNIFIQNGNAFINLDKKNLFQTCKTKIIYKITNYISRLKKSEITHRVTEIYGQSKELITQAIL